MLFNTVGHGLLKWGGNCGFSALGDSASPPTIFSELFWKQGARVPPSLSYHLLLPSSVFHLLHSPVLFFPASPCSWHSVCQGRTGLLEALPLPWRVTLEIHMDSVGLP